MIVDVHAHGLSEDFIVEAARSLGRFWRVEITGPRRYVDAHYGPLDPLLFDLEQRILICTRVGSRFSWFARPLH